MEWRLIDFLPSYEISENGNVKRVTRGGRRYPAGYVLSPKPHQRGYLYFDLVDDSGATRTMLAHRLVALAFLGPPPTADHEVAHNDGSRTNNSRFNLRWALPSENQEDRKRHGTYLKGENAPPSKLTQEQVDSIRLAYAQSGKRYKRGGTTYADLAAKYKVSQAQISRVVNNKHWT